MATSNSLQEQRYTAPKVQPQANRNQMQPQANRNQMQPQANRNQIQPQANRNQIQPQGDAQSVPVSKSKVRLKKVYLWLRENFFPIISDNDSDSEDEEERQAIREERKLMKNPPIIKSELRVSLVSIPVYNLSSISLQSFFSSYVTLRTKFLAWWVSTIMATPASLAL